MMEDSQIILLLYYQANSIIVWTFKSIVSILAIYFDFVHQLLRLNLIVLWCFLLDGIILLPITAPTTANQQCQGPCSDFSAQQSTPVVHPLPRMCAATVQ